MCIEHSHSHLQIQLWWGVFMEDNACIALDTLRCEIGEHLMLK